MSAVYKCRLVFRYNNKKECTLINSALNIDNYQFVMTKIDNKKLVSDITSRSISSLLHTLEDYLNCVNVAEKVAKVNNGSPQL